ncbi:ABC transporter transmembrane domain-containing protein [Microbacterium sp.]|uniref:ABC transporter transmembrane domain-containing protein n=1 Tax=Microbacterium sp. TaxID=51671 RepID=UPI003F962ABE
MIASPGADPAELGRGWLSRWLPVFWQAPPDPPTVVPFAVTERMSPARFLLVVIFSVKRFTVPAAVLAVLWQVGEALVPVVMGLAIDRALATGDTRQLVLWLVVLAAVFVMLSLAFRFAAQLTARATEAVQHRLRATLSRAVLHRDGAAARAPDGGVVSLMTNDVTRLAAVGLTVFPVGEFAGIVFIAVSLLVIHWPLGVAVLAGAPVVVWVMGLLSGRFSRDSRAYQTLLATTVGRATDLVAGYRVVKGIGAEAEAARRYRDASRQTLAGAYRNVGLLGRFITVSTAISGVFVAGVAALAGWFAVTGYLSIGGLIAAVGLAQALLMPMRMLAMNAVPAWASAIASSGRILDTLDPASPSDLPRTDVPTTATGVPIVELAIGSDDAVRVKPGELVGFVADDRTAAGLAAALLGPHADGAVRVSVGSIPGRRIPHGAYRPVVVVAPHHATLFSGTIADNLALPGAPARLREAALRAAVCEDFIVTAGGVDAEVGEGGGRFSGGQRQRLALARALATDAPVLVLHDPTTAVDSVTEQTIAARLHDMRHGRSTILITSSPALLSVCDRIVDLRDRGEAREDAS